jgi:hypothetical protein
MGSHSCFNELQTPCLLDVLAQDSAPQELTPGLTRQWLLDEQIVVFKATAVTRLVTDTWIDTVKDVMRKWPKDRPYLVIHDFRHQNIAFTPYARSRAEELVRIPISVPGYAAIIVPKSFVGQIIRLFMRTQKSVGIENRLYFEYHEGLSWLKSKIGSYLADSKQK